LGDQHFNWHDQNQESGNISVRYTVKKQSSLSVAHVEGKPLKLPHNHQSHGFDDVFKQKQEYLGSGRQS